MDAKENLRQAVEELRNKASQGELVTFSPEAALALANILEAALDLLGK